MKKAGFLITVAAMVLAPLAGMAQTAPPATPPANMAPPPAGPDHGPMGHHGKQHPGGLTGAFAKADTNGDGMVSRAEFLAAAGTEFDKMDANHDGQLTEQEMVSFAKARRAKMAAEHAAWQRKMREEIFSRLDANHDGYLDQAEFDKLASHLRGEDPVALFKRVDENGDGKISLEEFLTAKPPHHPGHPAFGPGGHGPAGRHG